MANVTTWAPCPLAPHVLAQIPFDQTQYGIPSLRFASTSYRTGWRGGQKLLTTLLGARGHSPRLPVASRPGVGHPGLRAVGEVVSLVALKTLANSATQAQATQCNQLGGGGGRDGGRKLGAGGGGWSECKGGVTSGGGPSQPQGGGGTRNKDLTPLAGVLRPETLSRRCSERKIRRSLLRVPRGLPVAPAPSAPLSRALRRSKCQIAAPGDAGPLRGGASCHRGPPSAGSDPRVPRVNRCCSSLPRRPRKWKSVEVGSSGDGRRKRSVSGRPSRGSGSRSSPGLRTSQEGERCCRCLVCVSLRLPSPFRPHARAKLGFGGALPPAPPRPSPLFPRLPCSPALTR
ncbi:uncharacterized protein LOC114037967 [Vombatus ursinus]|uniref:uncharacterized protein LOC114037967 n=1 Tax=Vombatus ursinus TaxID=29139 RepID=UPI000FFD732C|nr:uncharacterized protein LOC114037967 [Vombatus ursinus]